MREDFPVNPPKLTHPLLQRVLFCAEVGRSRLRKNPLRRKTRSTLAQRRLRKSTPSNPECRLVPAVPSSFTHTHLLFVDSLPHCDYFTSSQSHKHSTPSSLPFYPHLHFGFDIRKTSPRVRFSTCSTKLLIHHHLQRPSKSSPNYRFNDKHLSATSSSTPGSNQRHADRQPSARSVGFAKRDGVASGSCACPCHCPLICQRDQEILFPLDRIRRNNPTGGSGSSVWQVRFRFANERQTWNSSASSAGRWSCSDDRQWQRSLDKQ